MLFGGERIAQLEAQIQLVINRHEDARILYFLHRKENRAEVERALSPFPVEIRQAGRPMEVEVALSEESFAAVYSFASTALFTIKKIFPETRVIQINHKILASRLRYYEEIVRTLHRVGVHTVTLASFQGNE